jgi:cyclopropane fatty-acyl-phospholipid synthase-like methyltransferase
MPELTRALIERLPVAGPTDPIAYYRRPLVGRLFLERVNMGLRLLEGQRFERVLEIGYGAGAVLLAVAALAGEIHGLDLDADPAAVGDVLRQRGCQAILAKGDVRHLPYADGFFDLVISFSVFEHIREYRDALREVARALRPGGSFLLGMPAVNRAMSWGFDAIGFKNIDHHHVTTPREVARAFAECGFRVRDARYLGPRWAPMYSTWLLAKAE